MSTERFARAALRLVSPIAALLLLAGLIQGQPLEPWYAPPLLGVVVAAALWLRLRWGPRWWFGETLWSAAALALAVTTTLWHAELSSAQTPAGAKRRLERIIGETNQRFNNELLRLEQLQDQVLRRAQQNLETGTPGIASWRQAVTAITPEIAEGIALYDAEGTLIAWSGDSLAAPAVLLSKASNSDDPIRAELLLHGDRFHLFADRRVDPDLILVVERSFEIRSLKSPPLFELAWPPLSIEVLLDDVERREMDQLFSSGTLPDRIRGRGQVAKLYFPLRAPDGTVLAFCTVRDVSAYELRLAIAARWKDLGILILVVLLILGLRRTLVGFPTMTGSSTLLGASALLWGGRWMLSASEFPHLRVFKPLFNYGDYTSPLLGAWSRSPGDLLLTVLVALLQATLLYAAAGRLEPLRSTPRLRVWLGRLVLMAGCLTGFIVFGTAVLSVARNSRVRLIDISWINPQVSVLMLQASLFVGAATLVLFLMALGRWACRRCLCWSDRPWLSPLDAGRRTLAAGLLTVAAVTAAYYPFLYRGTKASRQEILRYKVLEEHVLIQRSLREVALREALQKALRDPELLAVNRGGVKEIDPDLAYRIWERTELAARGLDSSLRLIGRRNRVLSRFGLNLPEAFENVLDRSILAGPGPVRTRVSYLSLEKSVLYGRRTLPGRRGLVRAVEILVPDEYDNIEYRFTYNPYTSLFRPPSSLLTEPALLHAPAYLFVYDPESLQPIFSSDAAAPPPLSAGLIPQLHPGAEPVWRTVSHGSHQLRLLYARGESEIFAVGYRTEQWMRLAAGWVQTVLQNLALALLLCVVLGFLIAPPFTRRLLRALLPTTRGDSVYRRLLITLLLASLVPVLSLALFLEGKLSHEIRNQVRAMGESSLAVARRVVADYLATVASGARKVDDDLIYWLSQLIRQDIHIYKGSELSASSRRELFTSGLLSPRLRGEVYRELVEQGLPMSLRQEHIGREAFYVISGRVQLPAPFSGTWILSLPLGLQQEEATGPLRDTGEAILLSTTLLFALLSLLAYGAASRISRPIRKLAGAAGRLAAGDLGVHVEHQAEAELQALIDAFNRMSSAIRTQQEDLRARRDYIETILLNATTGVISFDTRGNVVTVNPAAKLLTGAGLEVGADLRAAFLNAGIAGLTDLIPEQATSGKSGQEKTAASEIPRIEERREEVAVGSGSEERRLRAVLVPLRGRDVATGGLLLLEDITENVRSNRLRAWAEMAQRIAHEIKNPLTPIQLSAEHLRQVYRDRPHEFEPVLEDCLRTITDQVRALRQIAREFSTYARIPELKLERVDLREVLETTLSPYLSSLPPELRIEYHWGKRPVPACVDRHLLQRAVVNLIENSLEALEGKGTIRVGLDGQAAHHDHQVRIIVEDDGPGIDPSILPRLFDPYFSTKGSGTGLGLAIARQAVEANGGTIAVECPASGRGTRMVIHLPGDPT